MTSAERASREPDVAPGRTPAGDRRSMGGGAGRPDARARPALPPGASGVASLIGLQRVAGNRAAAELAGVPIEAPRLDSPRPDAAGVDRGIGHAARVANVQREGEPHTPPPLSAAALRRAETIRGNAQARLLGVGAYNSAADRAIETYRDKRMEYATRWGGAWERHNTILAQAGEQAATQNLIEGVVIGAVASVVIAAAAAAAFPAAAGAAAFSASWWAFNAGTAVASSAAGTGAATVVGRPNVPGPTAGRRDAEADAWQSIAQVEAAARNVAKAAPKFGLELGNAEYSIAQVQAHIDGGTTDMNWDETLTMVSTLANWENSLEAFDSQLQRATTGMADFERAINAWQVPDINRLEREIWYAWMSQLGDDEVLDQDAIQQHLVRLGLIPNYIYFSDADQARAVENARRHVREASEPPSAGGI